MPHVGLALLVCLLVFLLNVLVAHVVIRSAVTSALREHDMWRAKEQAKAQP